jgi:DNA repair protein RecO (recombination protein O)
LYQAEGVIIKKENKGENDKVLIIFSREYGKIKLIAKGVRKNTSKLAGQLDLFSFVDIGFVLGKTYNILTSALEVENFSNIKNNLKKIEAVGHITEIVNKYTFFDKKDSDIFNILFKAFFYLSEKDLNEKELDYFLRYFEYRFLAISGYKPKEDELIRFFNHSGIISRKELSNVKLILERYFKNIFNEV